MGKYISFQATNLKSLKYILLSSISNVLNIYVYGFTYIECFAPMNIYQFIYEGIYSENNTKDFSNHRVFDPFFSYLGIIVLSFFFVKTKKENDIEEIKHKLEDECNENARTSSVFNIKLIYNKKKEYLKQAKGMIFYIIILILWIIEENLLLIYVDIFQDLDFWFFELIFVSIIHSRIFLTKIFSHQIIGVAISVIVGSSLKIYSITLTLQSGNEAVFYNKHRGLISFAIIYFLLITLRSYVNTQIKIFLDVKYISHRVLLMSYGIAGAVICFFTAIYTSSVTCYDALINYVCKKEYNGNFYYDEIHSYFESTENTLVRLIVIVLGMITSFSYMYHYTLVIKYYSPVHVIFSFPINFFLLKTICLIFSAIFFREKLFTKPEHSRKFLLDESGDIAAITGFLIYLEMIELHFLNLDFNIKRKIIERGEDDYMKTIVSPNSPLQEISSVDEDSDDENV